MNLLLHVGTEKTGSSYLQRLCAVNREYLTHHGIYFPSAGKDEPRLLQGSVSPGNGRKLAKYIEEDSWSSVTAWILQGVRKAESGHCGSLLISNENLFKSMSATGKVSKFLNAVSNAGVSATRMLMVLRDPVDQAVSLYKHRAKNGKWSSAAEWLQCDYSLPRDVSGFMDQVDKCEVNFQIRKYEKQAGVLAKIFIMDWLKVTELPSISIQTSINPSLTLSELKYLQIIRKEDPIAVRVFYDRFLEIPVPSKARNRAIEDELRCLIANHIACYSEIWTRLSNAVQADGGLDIPQPYSTQSEGEEVRCFSDCQLQAIASGHREVNSGYFRMKKLIRRLAVAPVRLARNIRKTLLSG